MAAEPGTKRGRSRLEMQLRYGPNSERSVTIAQFKMQLRCGQLKRWGNGSLSPWRKRSLTPEGWGIVREPDTSRQGREEQVSVPIRPGACPRKERMEGVSVPTGELAGTGCRDDFVAVVEHPAALVRSRVFGAGENGERCRGGVARLLKIKSLLSAEMV